MQPSLLFRSEGVPLCQYVARTLFSRLLPRLLWRAYFGSRATLFAAAVPEKRGDAAPADPSLAHSGAMLHAADSKFIGCLLFRAMSC